MRLAPNFTQAYTGADVCWPRLVTLYDGNNLVALEPTLRWNTDRIEMVAASLPNHGKLLTFIDQEFATLRGLSNETWPKHDHVKSVTIHGAYDSNTGITEQHVVRTPRPVGTDVHILSVGYMLGLSVDYAMRSPHLTSVEQLAFNVALEGIMKLTLHDKTTDHRQQFKLGITGPYYDVVDMYDRNSPDVPPGYYHTAFHTNYRPQSESH